MSGAGEQAEGQKSEEPDQGGGLENEIVKEQDKLEAEVEMGKFEVAFLSFSKNVTAHLMKISNWT